MEDFFQKFTDLFSSGSKHEEENFTFAEIVNKNYYPLEIHTVTTKDGYYLKLFRIPNSKDSSFNIDKGPKQPILFQHGIFDSSDGWMCNTSDKCLPFILADMGYDVWISNSRGNKHCKTHEKHDVHSYEFWQFSFHEMAMYDLPAVLEKVQEKNQSKNKIIYIAHSQGTCLMFAAMCMMNNYIKEKIKLFIAFAPVARVGGVNSTFLHLLNSVKIEEMFNVTKTYEVFPEDKGANKFKTWVNSNFPTLTNGIIDLISDNNSLLSNQKERMCVFFNHYPSGSSLKATNHFIQMFRSDKYCQYDYGKEANFFIYGQIEPKEYELDKITGIDIGLFMGKEDKLATPRDVRWLKDKLNINKNVVEYKEYEKMGHLTFLMPADISWYDDVLNLIKKYT